MGLFWHNNGTIQEDNGELENYSLKMTQRLWNSRPFVSQGYVPVRTRIKEWVCVQVGFL